MTDPNLRTWKLIFFVAVTTLISTPVGHAQRYCPPDGGWTRVVDSSGRAGYIDRKGSVVLRPEQLPERIVISNDFSDGLAAVGVNDPANARAGYSHGTTKFGFIDTTGNFVIKPQFDYAFGFCNGLAFIENGAFQGYINKTGTVVIDLQTDCNEPVLTGPKLSRCPRRTVGFEFVGEESEGLTAMSDGTPGPKSKYGFVDAHGRMVIRPQFEPEFEHHGFIRYLSKFVEGRAKVKLGGLYGFIDKKGKLIIPAKFTSVNNFSDGLAFAVAKNGDSGYIDRNGRWAIKPSGWDTGGDFKDGLAPVSVKYSSRREPFWGYIDRRGRIVIKPRFDMALEFRNGIASVYEVVAGDGVWEGRYGLIDTSGAYIWKPNSSFDDRSDRRTKRESPNR